MFRRVLTCSVLVSVAIALVATGGTATHASTPMPASGTLTYASTTFPPPRFADGNTIFDGLEATVAYTGTFTGTVTLRGLLIFHPDGSATANSFETFTGTVNGVPGTVNLRFTGGGPGGPYTGTEVIQSATGALAGLHGVLHDVTAVKDPNSGPQGSYSGQIQFGAP